VVYFKPGEKYLGGDFFYSEPKSYCVKFTGENELEEVKNNENYIPYGLRKSLYYFLITAANFYLRKIKVCNFIIHPSVRINDQNAFAEKIAEHLNLLLNSFDDEEFQNGLKESWDDLKSTKPDLQTFEEIFSAVKTIISEQLIKTLVLNSQSPIEVKYDLGYNIIVGGNTLGRGITLPRLQTVYYCRRAKDPQADTNWQHSRIFGYDRDQGLLRIFIPQSLFHLFVSLNESNKNIINQISENAIERIQILLPPNIRPTRRNVLNKNILSIVTGGVNYFPLYPSENKNPALDEILENFLEEEEFYNVNIETIIKILKNIPLPEDFNLLKFTSCVVSMRANRPSTKCKLIVRRNRDIGKYTGTLLSETDRKLGDKFQNEITLTMYNVIGNKAKGWNGNNCWIPNIKFPKDICYYDIE
ncbi:MAG: hypothetical protein IKO42_07050, partial [Opitutales bacterium]|nr:hypothetical protein [Opitutales bacterium]